MGIRRFEKQIAGAPVGIPILFRLGQIMWLVHAWYRRTRRRVHQKCDDQQDTADPTLGRFCPSITFTESHLPAIFHAMRIQFPSSAIPAAVGILRLRRSRTKILYFYFFLLFPAFYFVDFLEALTLVFFLVDFFPVFFVPVFSPKIWS